MQNNTFFYQVYLIKPSTWPDIVIQVEEIDVNWENGNIPVESSRKEDRELVLESKYNYGSNYRCKNIIT